MKRALSGWWDQIRCRDGWSAKIGFWPWLALQIVVPTLAVLPIIYVLYVWFPGDEPFSFAPLFIIPFIALVNSGRWKEDQKKQKQPERPL